MKTLNLINNPNSIYHSNFQAEAVVKISFFKLSFNKLLFDGVLVILRFFFLKY